MSVRINTMHWIRVDIARSLSLLYFFSMLILVLMYDGTGDEGDSILHFLFSKYAFHHPENFLNHWAKPVYVLITAPFAPLGFVAIKILNALLYAFSGYFMSRTAKNLKIPYAEWLPLFLFTTPAAYHLVLSGLTEPLFALWLVVGLNMLSSKRFTSGILWLSFLPFVRSEGLVILLIVMVYLAFKKNWFTLPLLITGHVVYSLIGYFFYGDLLWVFSKMTYATTISFYGKGELMHFIQYFTQIITKTQYAFISIGIIAFPFVVFRFIKGKEKTFKPIDETILIYGVAIGYFVAHSLFWYFGLFNSYGLTRVLVGIMPVFAAIMLRGCWLISLPFNDRFKKYLPVAALPILLLNLLFHWNWNYQLSAVPIFDSIKKAKNVFPELKESVVYSGSPAVAMELGLNWFDPMQRRFTNQILTAEWKWDPSYVVWDDHFSVLDDQVSIDILNEHPELEKMGEFESYDEWFGSQRKIVVFKFKGEQREPYVLLKDDFEAGNQPGIDDTIFYSGRYSQKLDSNHPYSKSLIIYLNSLQRPNGGKIRLSFSAFCPLQNANCAANVVFTHENNFMPFQYHSIPFTDNIEKGNWSYFSFDTPIQKMKDVRDIFKAYIWNPSGEPIFIDDLKAEWIFEEIN